MENSSALQAAKNMGMTAVEETKELSSEKISSDQGIAKTI